MTLRWRLLVSMYCRLLCNMRREKLRTTMRQTVRSEYYGHAREPTGYRSTCLASELLMPADLEATYGMTGGTGITASMRWISSDAAACPWRCAICDTD